VAPEKAKRARRQVVGEPGSRTRRAYDDIALRVRHLRPGDPVPVPPTFASGRNIMASWRGSPEHPIVSVICHTYNHADYVRDALNGFLIQETDFPFEIIVHDDASTDGTPTILEEYKLRFPEIVRLILQDENQLSQGKRPQRASFPLARGKYIAFCEGDDYWIDPEKLQKQVSLLEREDSVSVVYTDSIPFSDGKALAVDFGGARRDLSSNELKHGPAIFTLTSCFRNVIGAPPEVNVIKYGDQFLWARLGFHGSGRYMDEVLPSFYRVHRGGVHSQADDNARRVMQFESDFGMYLYFARTDEPELAQHFLEDACIHTQGFQGVSPRVVRAFLPMMRTITRLGRFSKRLVGKAVGR